MPSDNNKKPLETGKLGAIIGPNLKEREGKANSLFDFVRGFLTCPVKWLGEGLTHRMSFVRNNVWDLAFHLYGLLDSGKEKEAWAVMFAILCQYGKLETANNEAYHEVKRRSDAGDNQAKKLLEYAQITGWPVIWIKWSESTGKVRLESFGEAAARHLRGICLHKNEPIADSFRSFRAGMVEAGFFDMRVGSTITTAAVKERADRKARADADKRAKEAAKPVTGVGLQSIESALAEKKAMEAAAKKKTEEDKKKAGADKKK